MIEPTTTPIVTLYPFQRRWLLDKSRFKAGMFARQCGKTFTSCLEIVDDCFDAAASGQRTRWVILSRGERQAAEAMRAAIRPLATGYRDTIKAFAKMKITEEEYRIQCTAKTPSGDVRFEVSALEIRIGDSIVTAVPANPDTARGFSANVLFDEFAFHQDARAIWAAAYPIISAGFKTRVISTPNGKGNKFYEIMTEEPSLWSRHHVDIYKAVADGLPRNIDELRLGLNDPDIWAQEYELQWRDSARAWLDYELIGSCEEAEAGRPERYGGGLCVIGCDIARRRDLWVAWVAEAVGDRWITREIATLRGATFAAQAAELHRLMQRYRVIQLAIDQTGMGEPVVEQAQAIYGPRAVGVLFTAQRKLALATELKQLMQDRRWLIPAGDRDVREDLHGPRKVVGATGIPRIESERDESGHDDRFWAAALAAGAAAGAIDPTPDYRTAGVPLRSMTTGLKEAYI